MPWIAPPRIRVMTSKKNASTGSGRVADLGRRVQAREQPEHERREQTGSVHHDGELEQADHAPVAVAAPQVGDVERRLAEERARPRLLEGEDRPEHDAHPMPSRCRRTPRAPVCPRRTRGTVASCGGRPGRAAAGPGRRRSGTRARAPRSGSRSGRAPWRAARARTNRRSPGRARRPRPSATAVRPDASGVRPSAEGRRAFGDVRISGVDRLGEAGEVALDVRDEHRHARVRELPVPVAPATSPCRFTVESGSRTRTSASTSPSSIGDPRTTPEASSGLPARRSVSNRSSTA